MLTISYRQLSIKDHTTWKNLSSILILGEGACLCIILLEIKISFLQGVSYPQNTCIYQDGDDSCPWCATAVGATSFFGSAGQINWDYCNCCGMMPLFKVYDELKQFDQLFPGISPVATTTTTSTSTSTSTSTTTAPIPALR